MVPFSPPVLYIRDVAFAIVRKLEGGFTRDNGGRTMYGVSENAHPAIWAKAEAQNRLPTWDECREVYEIYWGQGHAGAIAEHKPRTAIAFYDACINMGIVPATRLLQRVLGVKKIDGIYGPITHEAIARDPRNDVEIMKAVLDARLRFYERLVVLSKKHAGSLKGWQNRIARLAHFVEFPA
jgi:lysozyme family protein